MKSFIEISDLEIYARHGVLPQETEVGNLFVVSVSVEYDFLGAAETDDISLSLNYAELTEIIVEVMSHPCKLLETVALRIKNAITERWPDIRSGKITICKPNPPIPAPAPRASISLEF